MNKYKYYQSKIYKTLIYRVNQETLDVEFDALRVAKQGKEQLWIPSLFYNRDNPLAEVTEILNPEEIIKQV